MAERSLTRIVSRASSAGCAAGAGPPDAALLAGFVADGDAAAFEGLVRRHGPAVWDVCRGVLRREADAEDAFQAVFLTLARRAATVRRPEALPSWLYGVALRVARKARALAARERGPVPPPPRPPDPQVQAAWGEVQAAVLEEVGRLPEKFRLPFVLCVLQGLGKAAAAARLGWPEGTVSGRLAAARARLRRALTRRGVVPAAGFAALDLAVGPARAVPPRLTSAALAAASPGFAPAPRVLTLATEASNPMATVLKSLALLAAAAVAAASAAAPPFPAGRAADPPAPPGGAARAADPPGKTTPLPDGAVARLGTTAFRHAPGVRAVAFAPGGRAAASAGDDGTVRLWDLATGRELRRYEGLEGPARAVAYADGGRLVVAVGGRDAVVTWEAASGKVVEGVTIDQEYALRAGPLAVSPDGRLVAGVGGHQNDLGSSRTVQVWDARTGREVAALKGHAGRVLSLAFSPDGKSLATGAEDSVVRVFDVATAKEARRFEGRWKRAPAVAFAPDGKALAVSANDGMTRVWEVATGREIRAVPGFGDAGSVAFSPDGTRLAVASSVEPANGGKAVGVWDLATGREVCRSGELDSYHNAVAFAPDGKTLATWTHYPTTNTFRLWDAGTGKEVGSRGGHRGAVSWLAFSPDGKALASLGGDGDRLTWSAGDWAAAPARPAGGREREGAFAYSPDGKVLAVGSGWSVTLTEAAGGKPRRLEEIARTEAGASLSALAFSPDGGTLVTVRSDGVVRSWGTAAGKALGSFETTGKADKRKGTGFVAAAVSPDAKSVAVVDFGGTVQLYDRATGAEVRRLEEHANRASAVAFAPDGKTLAYASEDVWLVDPATGVARRQIPVEGGVVRLAFSPDGSVLAAACADGGVRVYRAGTGAELGRLTGHTGAVYALAFSPDGKTLASGGADTTVIVWKVPAPKAPAPKGPAPKPADGARPGGQPGMARTTAAAYAEVLDRFEAAEAKWCEAVRAAGSAAEQTKAVRDRPDPVPYAREFLELARSAGPGDPAAADALLWVLTYNGSAAGFEPLRVAAAEALEAGRLAGVGKMTLLRACQRVEYCAHPAGCRLLRAVADNDPRADVRARAWLSLARHLAGRADVVRHLAAAAPDSELVAAQEAWFGRENTRLLREDDPGRLEKEAAAAYRAVLEKYADLPHPPKKMGDVARAGLAALESLAVGRPAPAVEGTAVDGKALKLSDYKGKVVLLVFSGFSWCGPCRAELKDHLALAKAYAGRPLAVVGVYAEPDPVWLRRYLDKEGVPWRAVREDLGGPLAARWNVEAWPTVYVIDAEGVIRFKGLRGKDLETALAGLVRGAEGGR